METQSDCDLEYKFIVYLGHQFERFNGIRDIFYWVLFIYELKMIIPV